MSMYYGSGFGDAAIPTAYATRDDLATWMGATAPVNADVLLRSATTLVYDATEEAYYTVDPTTGLPTDTQLLGALRDATCAQAAAWDAIKYNPLTGGVVTALVKKSKKIGSASFDVAGADVAAASQAAAAGELVPEALRILRRNNLVGNGPYAL